MPFLGKGRDPLAGPRPQHLKEAESPFQLHEEQESSVCLLVDNKREQSSWSSRQLSRSEDRAPVTFERRDWSSPQPSTRHEQPCPRPLKQEQSPLGVLLAKRLPLLLANSSDHLKRNEWLPLPARKGISPPAYKKKKRACSKFMRKK